MQIIYKTFKIAGLKCEQLSHDVTEVFPRIATANLLTLTGKILEKNNIETVIEVSEACQENYHLKSVLHIDTEHVDSDESFNLIADLIEQKKQSDNNVAIVCEKGQQLATTLALTHPIKYEGYKTRVAADIVLKKKPQLKLNENVMMKLKKWEWKVRKERMIKRSVEIAVSQLPLMSVMALFWLGIRMLQEKVEREHRKEKDICDYDYFDIIRWP